MNRDDQKSMLDEMCRPGADRRVMALSDIETGEFIGLTGLYHLSSDHKLAVVKVLLIHPAYISNEAKVNEVTVDAICLQCNFAFATLKLDAVYYNSSVLNLELIKLLKLKGFKVGADHQMDPQLGASSTTLRLDRSEWQSRQ